VLKPPGPVPGHVGPPIGPGELWTSWNTDPLVWSGLAAMGVAYLWASSRRHDRVARHRRTYFLAALTTLLVALVSPLDATGRSLSSAHMVQHLLLTSLAAPLIVLAAPVRTASAALSPEWRLVARAGRRSRPGQLARAVLARPVLASVPFVVVLWGWHLPAPYEAALGDHLVHGLEHVTMLATAMLSWAAIILGARRRRRDRPGLAILVLFGLSTASALLGVLLTFAPDVLYRSYERTATAWHLSALADQQLAGVIMWVPGGAVYLAVALVILIDWLGQPPAPGHRRQPIMATGAPTVSTRSPQPHRPGSTNA
jgi:putative membrane protein